MEVFLIEFEYEHWCQGYEWTRRAVLVHADSFRHACSKIKSRYQNAKNFEDYTIL